MVGIAPMGILYVPPEAGAGDDARSHYVTNFRRDMTMTTVVEYTDQIAVGYISSFSILGMDEKQRSLLAGGYAVMLGVIRIEGGAGG